MKILALDPATKCGWAYTDTLWPDRAFQYGCWDLGVSGSEHAGNKLVRLEARIEAQFEMLGVNKIALEDASFGSINAQTAAFHNMLRGVVLLIAARYEVPFLLYKPSTIKKFATGSGNAKKPQMIRAAKTVLGVDVGDNDNIADALFILELAKQDITPLALAAKQKPKPRKRAEPKLF